MTKTDKLEKDFDFELDLDDLIELLSKIKKNYPLHSDLRFQIEYGYESSTSFDLVGDREETKKEIAHREKLELNRLNADRERVRKEAERLGLL